MMPVHVALERAAGEAAAAIPRVECPPDRRRDGSRPAPDVQRFPAPVLDDRDQAGVAGEPPRGLGGDRRSLLELAAPGVIVLQRLGIHVQDDLLALPARQLLWAGSKVALRDRPQCLHPPRAM